ncbi:MAG: biliverdin-producing heme oxygenase [Myxococcales bacterium]|nr:biliverdin-producing heme oxygenase [Myxococcales bacterium]
MDRIASLFRNSSGAAAALAPRPALISIPFRTRRNEPLDPQLPLSLSHRLRAETQRAHRLTESTGFVRSILKGSVDLQSFRNMQAGLFLVYTAMEEEIARNARRPLIRAIDFPELRRTEALRHDLATLYAGDWRTGLTLTPARRRYVERIRWVGEHDPDLLVAHSYTRYLGDLSGGRVVEGIARRTLRFEGREGLRFFHFEGIPNKKAFKEEFRRRLDAMPLTVHRADALVAESIEVFDLNRAIFEELEGSWLRALRKLIPRELTDIRNDAN